MKVEQTILDQIRSRPRFKFVTVGYRDQYILVLKEMLNLNQNHFTSNINNEVAIIMVKSEANNYWKPNLSLRTEELQEGEETQTIIRGIFGPSAAVWTFFMFLYFIFGILWMVFITLWFVEKQIKSNDFPWALSLSFVMLFGILLTYLASLIGQRKAKSEMEELRKFAEESITQFH